jgi:phosphatidylglycerophosphatase A
MPRPLLYTLGTFFGTGFFPIAPATVASFAYAAIWWAAWTWLGPVPLWLQAVLLAAVTAIGIPIAGKLEKLHGEDPSLVVIDEIAGMQVTYLGVAAAGPLGWLAGLFWFRFFDIFKPLGVRRLEKLGGGGGVGIMADDIGAGVLSCLATHATILIAARFGWTL